MMRFFDEIKALPTDRAAMRKFGLTLCAAFGLIAAWMFWKQGRFAPHAAAIAGFFGVFGLAAPALLVPVHRAWMMLALCLGWVMTRVILTLVFFLVLTPIALILRLAGKDLLGTRGKNPSTYWTTRAITESDKGRFERQF